MPRFNRKQFGSLEVILQPSGTHYAMYFFNSQYIGTLDLVSDGVILRLQNCGNWGFSTIGKAGEFLRAYL